MLEGFQGRRVLLLQGPNGPFFQRLADELESVGAQVYKINFNAADAHYFPGSRASNYRGNFQDWPQFAQDFCQKEDIEIVFLFGDCRKYHRSVIQKFEEAAHQSLKMLCEVEALGATLDFIDMGGGLGVTYVNEETIEPHELIKSYETIFKGRSERLIVEPGRSISANAGVMLAKVEYEKDAFLITDAAMNDLLRPALYQAHHEVWQVQKNSNMLQNYNVVGPICETGDFLAKNVSLSAGEGDLLAIRTVGAYGFVMSSNYNSRTRAPEILVDKDQFSLIRRREHLSDLTALEEGLDD